MDFELVRDFVKFATFGVCIEVIYTAIYDLIAAYKNKEKINKDFKGESYIWMIPIYGSIAIFARLIFPIVQDYNVGVRVLIYGIIILAIEYKAGFILKRLTGKCPWHYDTKWSVHNYIRLDYLPLWMGFGFIVEQYYLYF